MAGHKHDRQPEEHRQQRHAGDGHVHRKDIGDGFAQIVEDTAPEPYGVHDAGKVVVHEDYGGSLAGDIRAALAHGYADVGGFEGGRVVNAVAGHGHYLAVGFERVHDSQLLLGDHAREDAGLFYALPEDFRRHRGQLRARDRAVRVPQAYLAGDEGRRAGIIPGYHHYPYARAMRLAHGAGHLRAHRIHKAHQAREFKIEVMLLLRQRLLVENSLRHAQHAQAAVGKFEHGLHHFARLLRRQMAEVDDSLGGALSGYYIMLLIRGFPHVGEGKQLL